MELSATYLLALGGLGTFYNGASSKYSLVNQTARHMQLGALAISVVLKMISTYRFPKNNEERELTDRTSFPLVFIAGFCIDLDWRVNLLSSFLLGGSELLLSKYFSPVPLPSNVSVKPLLKESPDLISYSKQVGQATLSLAQGDIFKQDVEVIVNAAQTSLLGGGGIDGYMHSKAGSQLKDECATFPEIDPTTGKPQKRINCRILIGEAVITNSYKIQKITPSIRRVVHTVGPDCRINSQNSLRKELLRSAYQSSLAAAYKDGCKSIAFPAISAGVFKYPTEESQYVALEAVTEYLEKNPTHFTKVRLVYLVTDAPIYAAAKKAWKV